MHRMGVHMQCGMAAGAMQLLLLQPMRGTAEEKEEAMQPLLPPGPSWPIPSATGSV